MAEKGDSCSLAVSLAVASLSKNGDLARKLAELSENMNQLSLYEDSLRQGVDMGIEGDAKQLANEYSLKQESTAIKFKAVLFGGLLANSGQGDEAIREMMKAISQTGGSVAEGLQMLDIMSKMDLTGLEEVAKIIGGSVEDATAIVEGIRKKLSSYIGSNYSAVTSGSQVRVNAVKKSLEKKMEDSENILRSAQDVLGEKTYKGVEKDLNRLKNGAKDNKKYRNTKAGREEIKKLGEKYGKAPNKTVIEHYLEDIVEAQKTVKEQTKILEDLTDEYEDALSGDLRLVEDGQNPYQYMGPDGERKFNKSFNKDISKRVLDYGQYVLARTLLTDTGDVPQSIYNALLKTFRQDSKGGLRNYLDEDLTEERILDEDRTLDELLSRAYLNTHQLVSDGQLREIYRQRLISLASDGELTYKDVNYLESFMRTMRLAGEGAGFADGFKYTALLENAKELGVNVPKKDGKSLWNSIVDLFRSDKYDDIIANKTITLKNGTELTHRQLLELVSGMLNDINIYKLIASNDYTDNAILNIAGKYLTGDLKDGNKRLISLVSAVKEAPTTSDTRGVILKALTGKDIPEGTQIGFFDFRSFLEAADDVKARAAFRDKLAEAHKINIPSNTIENITSSSLNWLVKKLEKYKGGYILVNDSQWKMNSTLVSALDIVNKGLKDEEKVRVAFPRGGLMGKLSREGGSAVFKTSYSEAFNDFLRRISIRTLGETSPDSSLLEQISKYASDGDGSAIAEMNRNLEIDARKYFGEMLGLDPYDERLPGILEDMTGISFKNYNSIVDKTEFWRKIDERFMIGMRTVGNYEQEVVTVADVIKQIDNMSPAEIATDLSQKFGYKITEDSITEGGKVTDKIKNAYINYNLSQTPIELLENKGKLLAVINGGVADDITINQFKSMLMSNDYTAYKDIFFHNSNLSDEELAKHVKSINTMILNGLSAQVADNLVAMGYSLPLVNVRDVVYDYLTDNLNVNGAFANAFIYKNNLPPTLSTLEGIMNEAMPSQLRFGYDDAVEEFGYDKNRYRYIEGIRDWGYVANDEWIDAQVELAKKDFRNGRTVAEIAKAYLIPVEYMDEYLDLFHRSVRARTSFMSNRQTGDIINTIILIRKELAEGTLSHELFHATFNFVPTKLRRNIVDGAMRLYGYDERAANEMLADLFSDYFRTGKFKLPRPKSGTTHSLLKYIKEAFESMKKWVLGVEKYEDEVRKLYDDILDLRYSPVDESELRELFGLTLDEAYEGETKRILSERGFDERIAAEKSKSIGANGERRRFHKSDKINNFLRAREDAGTLNDEAFRIAQDMTDEWLGELSDEVDNLGRKLTNAQAMFGYVKDGDNNVQTFYHWTRAPLFDSFNLDYFRTGSGDSLVPGFYFATQKGDKIMNNADEANRLIEVYLQAHNPVDYRKTIGDLWTLDSLRNFIKEYHNHIGKEYDAKKRDYKLEEWIKKDIRLKSFLGAALEYDGIFGNDVQDFLRYFKDNTGIDGIWDVPGEVFIVFTPEQIKYVTNERPTTDIRMFMREGRTTNTPDYITRYVEVENQFMPDTYSSLVALSAIKDGAKLPNVGHERQVLKNILDNYYSAVKGAVDGKNITFAEAQKLKTQAGYALDMYEQDYLYSRYKQFLTPDERSEMFGLKYGLGVTTNEAGLNDIAEYNSRILDRYDAATKRIINQNDIIASALSKTSKSVTEEVEKRQKELIEQGATMKVVDGQVIVVDTREELYQQLKRIPDSVNGLGVLKSMGRAGLEQLTNEQAYFLLNVVELARNADNKMNMISQTIYKLKPQLAKIDFFRTFRAVDGLPLALKNNLLTGTDYLAGFNNTAVFDRKVKDYIFERIKGAFAKEGRLGYMKGKKPVTALAHLDEIINDAIDLNVGDLGNSVKKGELSKFKKEAAIVYQLAFNPYTVLEDVPAIVKDSIDDILASQQNGIRESLRLLGDDDRLTEIIDSISIQLDDGSVKTLRQILDGDKNNLSKTLFDTDLDIVNAADENAKMFVDETRSESKKRAIEVQNKKIIEETENNYRDGLSAYLNEAEIVSKGERELLRRVWTSARQLAKQYTLTNKLADTDNALYGINEEIIRGFKSDILGLKGLLTRGGQSWLSPGAVGKDIQTSILERWGEVVERYRTLYSMSPEQLLAFQPKNALDNIAANLAKYFREIEQRLGSLDGVTGATTNQEVNKAFAHIGGVVMNIDSIQGLYSIMSGIEGNQFLKFFRFANVGDAARVDKLVIGGLGGETPGGYRNYVDKTDEGLDREWFNRTFASNFNDKEYSKMIQALCGFTIVNKHYKLLQKALDYVNGSNYLTRAILSYPGQMITVGQQSLAYFLRQVGWEDDLGVEDLGTIDSIRQGAGILKGAYNEISMFKYANVDNLDPSAFYNRYGLPDVDDLMQKQKFYTSDDLSTMYSKIDDYGAQSTWEDAFTRFIRNTDAYKDNANNIIDGLFARNFKNIAFVKALQSNQYMTFATASEFANFMASSAPSEMKEKLMSAIMQESGKNFRNILGLGFSGLDRAVGGGAFRNVLVGLMQMFNFRGAWGQNMARQASNWIMTGINMARKGLSKEGRDAIASYIAHQPEFVNFTKHLFRDLQNSWHLVRFQDNGDWMPENNEYSLMDFLEYTYEILQFSSQWWQGIQSYGPTRIGTEVLESMIQSYVNPEVYKDTYGVGALINAMSKNLGRNWKVRNLGMKGIAVWTTHGWDAAMEFLGNEFWKLSFGTLRYLMNEDETSYGYSTELIGGRPGAIPSIITGESNDDGDKAYGYDLANSETRLNISNWYNAFQSGDSDAARIYFYNNLDSFINGSQLWSMAKNIVKAVRPALNDDIQKWLSGGTALLGHVYEISTPWDLTEVGDIMAQTEAGKALMSQGYYVPTDVEDIAILVNEVLKQRSHRPGNDGFNKSMFNFDESGHMASLDESNEADAGMEMLLNNIKYERDDNYRFVTDENGNRIVTDYWKAHMKDLNHRITDEEYMTTSNFNFINAWVERNNDDPNYMLYKRLIGEGLAGRYMDEKVTETIEGYNKINGLKKDLKLTKEKLKNYSGDYKIYAHLKSLRSEITGEDMPFLESIMLLDKPAAMSANIKMVARQMKDLGQGDEIKKIFNINEKGEVILSSRYRSYLEEQAKLSNYLDEGDIESFVAETSSITKLFKKDDPYGLATTVLIASRVNRINQADSLSPEQKAKAIEVLFADNYEFIQQHIPEFIDELGSAAEAYIYQMNDSLYDISEIGDDLTYLNEMNKSKSGRSSGVKISSQAKNLLAKLGSSTGNGNGVGGGKSYNYNYVPVRLEGSKLLKATGSVGYNPKSASIAIAQYKPHIDLSIGKDINRNIKKTQTQTVSTKKQLSNIEKKTTKALTAES